MLTKQYIDEHQVLERYLADKLSDIERDEFEDYYAEHPEVLQDLNAVAGIKRGAALLRKSGELEPLTRQHPASRWPAGLALAASILIAVVVGGYWLENTRGSTVILASDLAALGSPLSEGASYQVQRTRSEVDAVVTLPSTAQAIKLRIRTAFETPPQRYRIALASIAEAADTRTPVAATEKLRLDPDGFVTVYLNTAYLRPGSYELRVADDAAPPDDPSANEFLIQVVPSTPTF